METDEEDLVRQADLDQYHHRVVQLSHAQRDLLQKKIEQLETRIREIESAKPNPHSTPSDRGFLESPLTPSPSIMSSDLEHSREKQVETPVLISPHSETDSTEIESSTVEPSGSPSEMNDSTERVMQMWQSGKSAEEIARELRMGRQEVQLLIEMSRHIPPVGAVKG